MCSVYPSFALNLCSKLHFSDIAVLPIPLLENKKNNILQYNGYLTA